MREGEARRRAGGERGEVQGKVQSAVERETREGGVGPRPGGPACQSGEDGAHHGALRDRSKTIREVRPISPIISFREQFFLFLFLRHESSLFRPGHHLLVALECSRAVEIDTVYSSNSKSIEPASNIVTTGSNAVKKCAIAARDFASLTNEKFGKSVSKRGRGSSKLCKPTRLELASFEGWFFRVATASLTGAVKNRSRRAKNGGELIQGNESVEYTVQLS